MKVEKLGDLTCLLRAVADQSPRVDSGAEGLDFRGDRSGFDFLSEVFEDGEGSFVYHCAISCE